MALTAIQANTSAGNYPVKNGFIHFSNRGGDGTKGSRALRRWSTDTDAVAPSIAPRTRPADEDGSKDSKENLPPNLAVPEGDEKVDQEPDPLLLTTLTGDFHTDISTPEPSPRYAGFVTPDQPVSLCSSPLPRSPGSCPSPESQMVFGVGLRSTETAPPMLRRVSLATELNLPGHAEHASQPALGSRASPNPPSLLGTYQFNFTLRLQSKGSLGLEFLPMSTPTSQALIVEQVLQDGAVEAWNKQCAEGGTRRHDGVRRGDAIVAVNGKSDCANMAEDCREKLLLKLTVLRTIPRDSSAVHLAPPPFSVWSDTVGCTCTFWAACARCRSLGKHIGSQADQHHFWTDHGDMTY